MTKEEVEDVLLEMARSKPSAEQDIVAAGLEDLIEDEEPRYPEELIEELEQESGLEFNI